MQKIVPHLWYDKEDREAALFYTTLFDKSRLINVATIGGTPSGDTEIVSFELASQSFMAISARPYFKFNPSISLMVACDSVEEVDAKWKALPEGGTVLMELGEYPFSKRYGWIQDRYGLSWQITPANMNEMMANGSKEESQRITDAFLKMKKFDMAALKRAYNGDV